MTKSKVRSTAQAFWIAMFAAALAACSLDFEKQAIVLESDGDGSITADGQSDLEDGKDQADDLTTDLTIDSVDTPDVTGDFADLTDTADLIPDQDATEVLDATDVAADTEADGTVVANPCAWSDATDLGGLDWTVGDGEVISGRYVGIDHFEVPAGVTAAVGALGNDLSGKVELCARIITIDGEINAAGAGPPGGVGGALNHAAEPGLGVAPGVGGQTGDAANATCRPYDSTPHQRGGPGELGAGAYYSVPADISTDDEVWIGSGGGGGGRGGKGGAATCCQRTAAGGGGGNGGAGGPGGGAVVLVATESLTVNGVIKTSGQSGPQAQQGPQAPAAIRPSRAVGRRVGRAAQDTTLATPCVIRPVPSRSAAGSTEVALEALAAQAGLARRGASSYRHPRSLSRSSARSRRSEATKTRPMEARSSCATEGRGPDSRPSRQRGSKRPHYCRDELRRVPRAPSPNSCVPQLFAALKDKTTMPGPLQPLLDAILADPEDWEAYQAYAAALKAAGDPRGELIRLQLEAEELDPDDPEREELQSKAAKLLRTHRATWLAELPMLRKAQFRLGLVYAVTANAQAFFDGMHELFARAPVRRLKLNQLKKKHYSLLAELLASRAFEALDLSGNKLEAPALEVIFAKADLSELRSLDLLDNPIGPAGCKTLAQLPLEALEELILGGSAAAASSLEETTFGDEALFELLKSTSMHNLRTLELSYFAVGPEGAAALAASPLLAGLEVLNLQDNAIGDEGAVALATSSHAPKLLGLNLGRAQINTIGVDALAASPMVEHLVPYGGAEFKLVLWGSQARRESRSRLEARLGGKGTVIW